MPNSPYCMIYLWWKTEKRKLKFITLGSERIKAGSHDKARASTKFPFSCACAWFTNLLCEPVACAYVWVCACACITPLN